MKKLLACLTPVILSATAAMSVVSCSQKTIPSLNDSSFALKVKTSAGEEKTKYDILRWSSEVLSADVYKKEFINLFKQHNSGIDNSTNPWSILELVKGQSNGSITNKDNPTLISTFIADYQDSSNTGDKKQTLDAHYFDNQLTYKIFDENNDDQLITTFNQEKIDGQWNDEKDSKIVVKQENDVYVVHLKIAIETKYSADFIGARQNIKDKKDINQYYEGLKDQKDLPSTDDFDYRYDIQFYYSIN